MEFEGLRGISNTCRAKHQIQFGYLKMSNLMKLTNDTQSIPCHSLTSTATAPPRSQASKVKLKWKLLFIKASVQGQMQSPVNIHQMRLRLFQFIWWTSNRKTLWPQLLSRLIFLWIIQTGQRRTCSVSQTKRRGWNVFYISVGAGWSSGESMELGLTHLGCSQGSSPPLDTWSWEAA